MLKKLFAAILSLLAAAAFAAVDVNKATQADLESIKGIGPVISAKILEERRKAPFKDWNDMVTRVKGVGEGNAAKFSADGLTVNGAAFAGGAAAKQEGKSKMKADTKSSAGAESGSAKTSKTAAKAAESTPAAPAMDKGGKNTPTAAPTDATRKKQAEERAARDAALAEKKAARKSAAASAPASAPAKK